MEAVLKTKDGKIVVLNDNELKREILNEAHQARQTIHHGNTKMYQDLKNKMWCGMKHGVAKYLA